MSTHQLTNDCKNRLTAVINKAFSASETGKSIRHILDRHIMGGTDPNNPRAAGEIGAFRDVYPPIQTGPDIEIVNELVSKLFEIYSDIAKFINDPLHPTEGVLSPGVDSELDTAVKRLAESLDNDKKDEENPNKGYKVELMLQNLFSSLSRDALVGSIIHGYRIQVVATNLDITGDVGGGNYSFIFGGENKKKYINSPFPEFDPSEYDEKSASAARAKHNVLYLPHEEDGKMPFNELGAHTIAIFLRKGSPFAHYIRSTYGLDVEHIKKTYPEHKYPFEEAKSSNFSRGGDMDSRHKTEIPVIEYVYIFLKRFVRACLCNKVDSQSLKGLFAESDSALSAGDEKDKDTITPGDETLDFFNGNINPYTGQADGNQFDTAVDAEEGNERNTDILPKNVASEFGGEDRHLMTILCNEALEELCGEADDYANKFDFHVLDNTQGVGHIATKNLYYSYIKPMFDHYEHSEQGIMLIYHFYNSIGKDNIGLTIDRLKLLKNQLPKSPEQIKFNSSGATDLLSKLDRQKMNSEAVSVACTTAENVFLDIVGTKNFRGSDSRGLVKPLEMLLNPMVCNMPATILTEMKKLWSVSRNAHLEQPKLEEARKAVNVRSVGQSPQEAIDQYITQVQEVFNNIDPEYGFSKSGHANQKDYVYLYPTNASEQAGNGKYILFPDKSAYTEAYHNFLENLQSSKNTLASCDDMIEFETLIVNLLKSHFPADFWKLRSGKSLVGSLLIPNIRVSGGGVIELKDLLSRKLAGNISNQVIKAVLESAYGKEPKSVEAAPEAVNKTLDMNAEQRNINNAYAAIAMLHCRIEFLLAVKQFSDEIIKIFEAYRPTVEPIPEKAKELLSDYERLHIDKRLQKLLKTLVRNIVFRILHPGQEDIENHPEIEDPEYFQGADPEYEDYLNSSQQRESLNRSLKNAATALAGAELPDDE